MHRPDHPSSLEDALRTEFGFFDPSPATASAIDRRVTAALAAPAQALDARLGTGRRARPMTVAPLAAIVAAVVLGTVIVAALASTAEDQRVHQLTACMRDRGWEVADPNGEGGTGHVVPGFPSIVDESRQAAFNTDLEACARDAGIPLER